jgi:lipopolysaccharide export LptBFGC system permease protein LptF
MQKETEEENKLELSGEKDPNNTLLSEYLKTNNDEEEEIKGEEEEEEEEENGKEEESKDLKIMAKEEELKKDIKIEELKQTESSENIDNKNDKSFSLMYYSKRFIYFCLLTTPLVFSYFILKNKFQRNSIYNFISK